MSSLIPEDMKRNGRPALDGFDPSESLYYRFDSLENGKIPVQGIRFPDQSTNWSRLGPPEWLRLVEHPKFANAGLAAVVVDKIPKSLKPPTGGKDHNFKPAHVPEDENYPHAEIQLVKDGKRAKSYNDMVRMEYRIRIAQASTIVSNPLN